MSDVAAPLRGVRVLDLSRVLAGPYGSMILADLGADVLKVERPDGGDDLRAWGPFLPTGESTYFAAVNRNKRSIAVDLTNPKGTELIRRLAATSDVMIENFRPGTMERYGLDAEAMASLNPRLIYCSLTAFGASGPYASLPGYDVIMQAMGGLMSVTGEPDGRPMRAGVAVVDIAAGLYIAIGVLAALRGRDVTGAGSKIDLSLLGVELATLVNIASAYLLIGSVPARLGNSHPSVAPYEAFRAADGYFVVAVATDEQWRRFCTALGLPELATDSRFLTRGDRVLNRDGLTAILEPRLADRRVEAIVEALRHQEVPAGPVNTVDRILEDPHVAEMGILQPIDIGGRLRRTVGSPVQWDGTSLPVRTPPPDLGQDTDDVLQSWLGCSPSLIAELRSEGVVA